MSRDLDLTRQPAQPCVLCGGATDASVHMGNRKVPMCPDCSIRFEDYLAEKHGAPLPCPPVLYRYRAPSDLDPGNDGGPSRFEQFLTTDQVWASNPTQFNDPYDCRQTYDFAASPEEWEKHVDQGIVGRLAEPLRAEGKLPRQHKEELKALEAKLKKEAKYNDPAVQADMGRRLQESLEKARILCLCETQTNPRLWAHYSDGHRGFCLEFDTTLEPFSHARRVRYTRDYPKLDINATPDQCLRTFLLTKSEIWKDEEEWRCVVFPGGPGALGVDEQGNAQRDLHRKPTRFARRLLGETQPRYALSRRRTAMPQPGRGAYPLGRRADRAGLPARRGRAGDLPHRGGPRSRHGDPPAGAPTPGRTASLPVHDRDHRLNLLARVTAVLRSAGIPYALIGASAMAARGVSRATLRSA
jgi:DUF2971 family protein